MAKMRKGTCKIINTPGGKRKLCRLKNGKVRFRKMGRTTTRRKSRR